MAVFKRKLTVVNNDLEFLISRDPKPSADPGKFSLKLSTQLSIEPGKFSIHFCIYTGAKKYSHPYYINTIEMRSL